MSFRKSYAARAAAGLLAAGTFITGITPQAASGAVGPQPAGVAADKGSGKHWSYHGSTGPAHWGELGFPVCGTGKQQSPVNLSGTPAGDVASPAFAYRSSPVRITDSGHSVEAGLPGDGPASTLTAGGRTYRLVQLHYHAPSEHQVDGMLYPAEIHFVHEDSAGNKAVAAVFLRGGGPRNQAWEPFISRVTRATAETALTTRLDLAELLPRDRQAYQYRGSLTTPPCTEGVSWVVLTSPVTISTAQLTQLMEAYSGNNRPVQQAGGRTIALQGS